MNDPLERLESEARTPGVSRLEFGQQLDALESELIVVANLVSELIVPVTTAFLQADNRAAGRALAVDVEVDRRCLLLEERCFALLARQSPVAGDLRRVVAVLRSIGDVQRSADLLRHVAEALAWVHPPSLNATLATMVAQQGELAGKVFAGSVEAWRRHDALAAVELQRLDDDVDLLQKSLLTQLYLGDQTVEESVSLALICRYYERIADHGVEMARQVTYVLTGDRPMPE